ncbi:efflux ABC transporter (ATP-binding protein) [Candidatus Bipolaricaulis anaerobius]|jgi:ATP-binding cassette subfamily B protein|uniref:Efflux ABC transporter (ATP-binding protein) n=1 Tax=Candidatus Bipolaricaulis anaerobius TaxID=2026885 RepID=A0A2X3L0W4_9BACT|nr:ABC transporter ATP-binding protein [Candidatus Bipolaricaulis anaerobius]SQD92410.1 efflux ABC transporter (ATP-binding protein) [Candidatus Bipolaricaulis anaerobius]
MRGIFRELWRYRWRLLTGVLALFVVDTLQLIAPLVVRSAVNDLVAGTGEHLVRYALYLVVIAAVVFGFRFLWRILLFGAGRLIERDMRNRLYAHLLKLSPAYYVEHSTGDLMAHATNDLEAVRRSCSQGVLMASDAVIMISVSLAAMIGISPLLTLYAFVPLPFITLAVVGFGRLIHRRFERAQAAFSALTERVREALSGVRLLRAFAREEGIEGAFSVTNRENVEANMALTRVSGVFDPAVGLLAGLGTVIILWFGGRGVLGGTLSLGDLVAFMNYLGMMVWPMMAIGWVVNTLQQGAASMKRLDRIFAEEPDITSPAEPLPMPSSRRIEFRDLTFTYPGTARPALRDVNLIVEEGTTLGVVGLTGSGKSTLVRLLPRLYDPPPGTVLLGGVDIRLLDLGELRGQIAMAPQDVFLFSATLRENIAYGRPEASEDEVWEAARLAGLAEEVASFPDGLDTIVGERGVTLSGGQRQRVGIARALLLNAPILILDDVLSSVDAQVEEEILGHLRGVLERRTAIVVAHRITAVREADHIIVLDGGRIVEQGDHSHLVRLGGLYARLNELQQALVR